MQAETIQLFSHGQNVELIGHRPHLILPRLIDTHNHLTQMQVIGSYGAQLLEWLNTYTFPAEARFSDEQHAERITSAYFDEMLRNGTTTTVAFCSVHKNSTNAYFAEAERRNMCVIGGKVLMDRNAPGNVLNTPQQGYDETKILIDTWHGRAGGLYAITPRFAITSTPAQLEMAQVLFVEYPDCYMQTHLAENHKELEFTLELFPSATDYLSIYESYGLLGEKKPVRALHSPFRPRAGCYGRNGVCSCVLSHIKSIHWQRLVR